MFEADDLLPLDRFTVGPIDAFPPGHLVWPLDRRDGPYFIVEGPDGKTFRVGRSGRSYHYSDTADLGPGIGLHEFEVEVGLQSGRGFLTYSGLTFGALVASGNDVKIMASTSEGVVHLIPLAIKIGGVKNVGAGEVAFGKWRAVTTFGQKTVVLWEHPEKDSASPV